MAKSCDISPLTLEVLSIFYNLRPLTELISHIYSIPALRTPGLQKRPMYRRSLFMPVVAILGLGGVLLRPGCCSTVNTPVFLDAKMEVATDEKKHGGEKKKGQTNMCLKSQTQI